MSASAHALEPVGPFESPSQLYESRRVAFHINGGVGIPTGMAGLSVTVDLLRNLFVEVGAGWDFVNDLEGTVGVGAHILLTPGVAINPRLSYVISEGASLLADFGCSGCGEGGPGHWLDLSAQLEVRTQSGFDFRFSLGIPMLFRASRFVPTLGAGLSVGFVL